MSMADDNSFRSYRSHDPHLPAAESPRPRDQGKASDPLAELARLIGQSDPFADLGRTSQRPVQSSNYPQHDSYPAQGSYAGADDWTFDQARTQRDVDYRQPIVPDHYVPLEPPATALAYEPHADDGRGHSSYQEPAADPRHQPRQGAHHHAAPRMRDDRVHAAQDADDYEFDDAPLEPHEEAMYDDAPRKRRHGGLATTLALIGCAMLGTAGAYAYRSYYAPSAPSQPPPVIAADSSTPTKIVPIATSSVQTSRIPPDRTGSIAKEQVVSKQEEPVAVRELGTQAAPRVVLPAPIAPVAPMQSVPAAAAAPPAPPPGTTASVGTEPRRVRTVVIRPDGPDPSARPVGVPPPSPPAATTRSTTPPAPRAVPPARNGSSPISLEPQTPTSEPVTPPRTRTATAPADRTPPEATTSGVLVQLSSQKSESDALASFRSLQAKFPNELSGRQPIVRRVDLGSKGIYYRTNVGPFPSAQEASKFCASYKAAGGQCVVPTN
jgi:SPOR domain